MRKMFFPLFLLFLSVSTISLVYTHLGLNKSMKAPDSFKPVTLTKTVPQVLTGGELEPELPPRPHELLIYRQLNNPCPNPLTLASNYPLPKAGVPVLMYHSISIIPGNNLGVPPQNFVQQMLYLHDAGFTTVSMDDLYSALTGNGKLPKRPILITFDDGYADNYTVAFPVLKKYGFRATFFVVSSFINTPGMLSWLQLQDMLHNGMAIGSHTVHHWDLSTLTASQQQRELADSKNKLQSMLGTPVDYFCYPSGKYNNTTLLYLKKLMYKAAVTTINGRVKRLAAPYELNRIRINGNYTLQTFTKLVDL